ncbi:MAG: hypothetical protein Q9P14_14640 [candidate division KSB1 bacterium]|nr:hypothetical protein [candidate division KSB1 bacterium]
MPAFTAGFSKTVLLISVSPPIKFSSAPAHWLARAFNNLGSFSSLLLSKLAKRLYSPGRSFLAVLLQALRLKVAHGAHQLGLSNTQIRLGFALGNHILFRFKDDQVSLPLPTLCVPSGSASHKIALSRCSTDINSFRSQKRYHCFSGDLMTNVSCRAM